MNPDWGKYIAVLTSDTETRNEIEIEENFKSWYFRPGDGGWNLYLIFWWEDIPILQLGFSCVSDGELYSLNIISVLPEKEEKKKEILKIAEEMKKEVYLWCEKNSMYPGGIHRKYHPQ